MSNKLKITERTVFDGYEGATLGGITYRLACGAYIIKAPNGDLLCNWLTGSDNEPSTDNCTVISRSCDNGLTWGKPEMLVPTCEEGNGSAWLFTVDDKIVQLSAKWPLDKWYTVWNFERSVSYDNGHTFSEKVPIKLIDREDFSAVIGQHIVAKDGKNILSMGTFEQRKVPLVASAERLAFAKSEEEAAKMPKAEDGERYPEIFAKCLHGCAAFEANKDFSEFNMLGGVSNRPLGLLEPSIIELKSGRLVMFMRGEWAGYIWRSDSDDGGKTWCDAYPTNIKNPTNMVKLIRVPDGRIVLIHNDCGGIVGKKPPKRDPLSIWVSSDEMETWEIKENIGTGGNFAYPQPLILDDGKLVFVYDFDRRKVKFVEVELP